MKDKGNELYTSSCIQTRTLRESPDGALGILLDRSKRMDRKQKALLWMILDQGASYHQVARLSGEHASTVSRRFRAMVRRLRGRPLENAKTALSNLTPLDKTHPDRVVRIRGVPEADRHETGGQPLPRAKGAGGV